MNTKTRWITALSILSALFIWARFHDLRNKEYFIDGQVYYRTDPITFGRYFGFSNGSPEYTRAWRFKELGGGVYEGAPGRLNP